MWLGWAGLGRCAVLRCAALGGAGPDGAGLGWTGLGRAGLGWAGLAGSCPMDHHGPWTVWHGACDGAWAWGKGQETWASRAWIGSGGMGRDGMGAVHLIVSRGLVRHV